MISAPRRSEASPSPNGDLAIFSSTSYSFSTHAATSTWNLLDVKSGQISKLPFNGSEVSEIVWVGPRDTSILYINGTNDEVPGGVTLWLSDARKPTSSKLVASLPAAFSGLKASKTANGGVRFLVNALANPDGTVYNEETAEPTYNTGRLYEGIYVRHWDVYLTPQRYAVFSGTISRQQVQGTNANSESDASSRSGLKNLLRDVDAATTRPETPVQPFGDLNDYDLSPDGSLVAFLTKAPQLPKANYTASYIYLVPSDGSRKPVAINGPGTAAAQRGHLGASASPRFSPDGRSIAYVQMDGISYESDRNKLYVASLGRNGQVSNWHSVAENWDRSPSGPRWNAKGDALFVVAEDKGTSKIFNLPTNAGSNFKPKNITSSDSTVVAFDVLKNGRLLVSASAYYTSIKYYTAELNGNKKTLFDASKTDPELKGLSPNTVDEFYFRGSEGVPLQSYIIKPTNFQKGRTYPLLFYVHGGPQGSNANAWSTRWNLQTWADQGYVVVAPNPTGSTGFGQRLTDAIQNQWGGTPYYDLELAWEYVAANLSSYVDVKNGVEAGASYGGFMTNWIQGHDLGRKFKALVTHDGSTSTLSQYASEELWFMQHDFNGTLWNDRANYERWDPIAHALNFSTPHFVVHSENDYRLPVSEGIMMFNVLQELGIPSRFLNFPDETHWVVDRENSLFWHKEIFNWINHWSGIGGPLDNNAITT